MNSYDVQRVRVSSKVGILVLMSLLFFDCIIVTVSEEFQIQSTKVLINSEGEEIDLCLEAKNPLQAGAKIVTKSCAIAVSNQKFTVDEYGRFHTVNDENLCLTKLNGQNIELFDCGSEGSNVNMFVLNSFDNTISWRRNGAKVISVKGDEPVLNKAIKLRKRKLRGQMQQYHIIPSTLFLSWEDLPTSFHIQSMSNELLCLEASSSDPGSSIILNTCEKGNANQMWRAFPTWGLIGLGAFSSNDSKCIVKQANTLILGSCLKSNSNMFMYNAVDDSIHWRRNGKKAITVNNQGNVVLSNKQISNPNQMWSLQDIMTLNNQIEFLGNPCTDYFPGEECALCTGDCNDDSDCYGDLRCAQRDRIDGLENVPGCDWGTNTQLQISNRDYCFLPTSQPGVINYVGECDQTSYLCGLCEGNCESNSDCEDGLFCVMRDGFEAIDGCTGEGGNRDIYGKNVCGTGPM